MLGIWDHDIENCIEAPILHCLPPRPAGVVGIVKQQHFVSD